MLIALVFVLCFLALAPYAVAISVAWLIHQRFQGFLDFWKANRIVGKPASLVAEELKLELRKIEADVQEREGEIKHRRELERLNLELQISSLENAEEESGQWRQDPQTRPLPSAPLSPEDE